MCGQQANDRATAIALSSNGPHSSGTVSLDFGFCLTCWTPVLQSTNFESHLTDSSLYTGAHRERFDEDGHGRGIEGRVMNVHTASRSPCPPFSLALRADCRCVQSVANNTSESRCSLKSEIKAIKCPHTIPFFALFTLSRHQDGVIGVIYLEILQHKELRAFSHPCSRGLLAVGPRQRLPFLVQRTRGY